MAKGGILKSVFELTPGDQPERVQFEGPHANGISPFAVSKAATLSVASAHVAAHQFGQLRGINAPAPTINREHALAAFSGFTQIDGQDMPKWAALSGQYESKDGHVQVHANFPHHSDGLVELLGVDANRESVAAAIKQWNAEDFETEMIQRGLIGAKYRTLDEWAAHPHALATNELPLISVEQIGDAPARAIDVVGKGSLGGVKVLDCSRVLAGPVAGLTLAAEGAQVLRVGAERLPSVPVGVVGTGAGKRNTFLDLATAGDAQTFAGLMADADVFIDAYRPHALANLGFGSEQAAQLSPGIVVVQVSAFDWVGPWAGRRGFDSIMQTTTGLADAGGKAWGESAPKHLPVQALDYATGFLAAHAAARLLAHQAQHGGSWLARLSLLRTRNWLRSLWAPDDEPMQAMPSPEPWLHTLSSDFGQVTIPKPVNGAWETGPTKLGSSQPVWLA